MAETIANLEKGGSGGYGIPNYGAISIVAENSALNFAPTTDGLLVVLSSPNGVTNANLQRNGTMIAQVCNTISMPVDKGARYTTDVSIRVARFAPFN